MFFIISFCYFKFVFQFFIFFENFLIFNFSQCQQFWVLLYSLVFFFPPIFFFPQVRKIFLQLQQYLYNFVLFCFYFFPCILPIHVRNLIKKFIIGNVFSPSMNLMFLLSESTSLRLKLNKYPLFFVKMSYKKCFVCLLFL